MYLEVSYRILAAAPVAGGGSAPYIVALSNAQEGSGYVTDKTLPTKRNNRGDMI